jgi:chromate transporter
MTVTASTDHPPRRPAPSLGDLTRASARVAAQSFGGPAGQVAVMHRIFVDELRWISGERFTHALGFCMLLPGPEAQQLATTIGWQLHGVRGGLVAGGLFVLPGFLSIWALSLLYWSLPEVAWVGGALFGLQAAALALIAEAALRLGRRVLHGRALRALALLSLVTMTFTSTPFPLIVIGAGALGMVGARRWPGLFAHAEAAAPPQAARPPLGPTVRTAGLWLLLWLGPVAALSLALGGDHVLAVLARFFSGAATVTFGGAYAVLGYVAQHAVEVHGWLTPEEMLDGLSMAETTPGPLIQVVQFVGFLAAARAPGPLHPMVAGTLGAVVTTWVTFAPSFLWIFAGAPYLEWLRGDPRLRVALSCVSAAVVGVIAHLGLWMALRVCFAAQETVRGPAGLRLHLPVPESVDLAAVVIAALAAIALLRLHLGAPRTLLGAVGLGVAWALLRG